MKRFLLCLLLAGVVFSLFAQTQTVSVFWPLVTGTGIDQRDNDYFYLLIYHELEAKNYVTMGRASYSSDFSLIGVITAAGRNESTSLNEYRFSLFLQDNKTGEIVSEQGYRYSRLEATNVAVLFMLDTIFDIIKPPQPEQPPQSQLPPRPSLPIQPQQQTPPSTQQQTPPATQHQTPPAAQQQTPPPTQRQTPPADQQQDKGPQHGKQQEVNADWREKWFFVGFSAFWNPRIYSVEESQIPYLGNYLLGFYPEIRFLDSVSLETGLGLSSDWIKYGTEGSEENYQDLMLEVPLLVKIVLKPGDVFLLQPYSGVSFNISLLDRKSVV